MRQTFAVSLSITLLVGVLGVFPPPASGRVLAATSRSTATTIDAGEVASQVKDILSEARFRADRPESWWERLRRQIRETLVRWFLGLAAALGGNVPATLLLVGVVVGLGVILALTLGRRRADDLRRVASLERLIAEGGDPALLEQQASAAADRGDHAGAIRLLFVAGLLRLDQRGRITFAAGTPNFEVSTALGSDVFDRLWEQFDQTTYGDRPADADAYSRALSDWASLLVPERT